MRREAPGGRREGVYPCCLMPCAFRLVPVAERCEWGVCESRDGMHGWMAGYRRVRGCRFSRQMPAGAALSPSHGTGQESGTGDITLRMEVQWSN